MKTLRTIAITNIIWSFVFGLIMMFRLPANFSTAFGAGVGTPRTASRYEMILVPLFTLVVQIIYLFIFKWFIKQAYEKTQYNDIGENMVGMILSGGVFITGFLTGISVSFNYVMYSYAKGRTPNWFLLILIVLGFIGFSFLMFRGALDQEAKKRIDED